MANRIKPAVLVALISLFGIGCSEDSAQGGGAGMARPASAALGADARVIALAPNAAEILCGIAACSNLVGVSEFCTYPPQLSDVPRIGGLRDPNLELVVTLAPDLVILRGQRTPLRRLCAEHDIRVYDDAVETLGGLYRTIRDVGQLMGREGEAAALAGGVKTELDALAARVRSRHRPRVLFTLRSPGALSNVMTAGGETFIHELIELVGGENVFGELETRYPAVSLEEIVARDPEVVIEAMAGVAIDDARREALRAQWSRLGPISAVQTGRIHFVTAEYLTIPSQRVTWSARLLGRLIHPKVFDGER